MLPGVVGDLEQRIDHELLGAVPVREHPFSADEERRLDRVLAQEVDDVALVTGNFERLLAEIEGERDEFLAGGQFDAPDRAALRDRRIVGEHAAGRRDASLLDALLHALIAPAVSEVARRPASRRRLRNRGRAQQAKP